jgi:hypothetical protein
MEFLVLIINTSPNVELLKIKKIRKWDVFIKIMSFPLKLIIYDITGTKNRSY